MPRTMLLLGAVVLLFACALPATAAPKTKPQVPAGPALMAEASDLWVDLERFVAYPIVGTSMTGDEHKQLDALMQSEVSHSLLLLGHARAAARAHKKSLPEGDAVKGVHMATRSDLDEAAGTYHVLLENYLGRMRQSKVEDRDPDDEVWSEPLAEEGHDLLQRLTNMQKNKHDAAQAAIQNAR